MSEENLKAFLVAVKSDVSLQDKLKLVSDPDAVVSIAKEAGFSITTDELKQQSGERELSDDELEEVAGGYKLKVNILGVLEAQFEWE
jgi:predicted ribosomally synthesized peptide with nif11-like leader